MGLTDEDAGRGEGKQQPYSLVMPPELSLPIVIAAPHGGRAYSDQLTNQMRRPNWSQLRLEDRHIDTLALEVAAMTGAAVLVAKAPRAMIDLNRAPDDVDWSMIADGPSVAVKNSLANRRARSGLGLVPRRLPGLGEIWNRRLSHDELQDRLMTVHQPYHEALEATMARIRDKWGAALLLDLHSMPPLKPQTPNDKPAEFVIGDRFGSSCDGMLSGRALDYFGRHERRVAHNRPYSGGYVLDRHSAPARGLHAMQVEVCRSSYLDHEFKQLSARSPGVVRLLAGMVRRLAPEVASIGGGDGYRLAAE